MVYVLPAACAHGSQTPGGYGLTLPEAMLVACMSNLLYLGGIDQKFVVARNSGYPSFLFAGRWWAACKQHYSLVQPPS
ncbi:hypothetical protein DUNSADRAFT_18341 [Dunaliella salina]|uniref:Uncharacterized protein n=1 Tax=Dunaliella salina TaxID=3046 RepID=A0ABQ7G098_DUNSA|nr:hypothetical protein DUNSADRAFT_18341 [Dunaliella salina]|eukprot:KAF5828031.1 hypothetical protein DUNSADRAFT_18341 [Dunaliella salina]